MFTKEQLIELNQAYSDSAIAKTFGCTSNNVRYWRRKFAIPISPARQIGGKRSRSLNTKFFAEIDTESKAYILGFLTADGSVHKNGKSVSIALHHQDEQILQDIRSAMDSTATMGDKVSSGGFSNSAPQKQISFCSRELIADLAKLGVLPNKSFTTYFPDIPEHLHRHYIRGIWDGDGHINKWNFSVLGSAKLLDKMQHIIMRNTGSILPNCPDRGGFPRLVGYRRDKAVLQWLHADASIFLDRKHAIFLAHWS